MKQVFVMSHDLARQNAIKAVQAAPDGFMVQISEPNRTLEQNAAQWPYLEAFSKQKQLCINGEMVWASPDDWKDVLTACWNGEMRMAAFDGRVIMLPQRTSKLGKGAFSTWMEYLVAMAAQCGVEPVYKSEPRERYAA
ncbi:recombination protein NinB [uncultured Rhodoferax sp.]|uniref:recombination protein NinB n=1 Tax=uncultured Rhodoferax sp. TaxID=223188 RepID=UPI0025F17ECB|nr:recombination protein NinB [uncultured Rhodoferax sp.]